MQEINQILEEQQFLTELYGKLLKILPSFNIADKKVLPYGLKSHTRSVSWLVEQVVCQQTKFRAKQLGLKEVKFDMPDTCLHDCEIKTKNKTYYVNIKIHNSQNSKKNKNESDKHTCKTNNLTSFKIRILVVHCSRNDHHPGSDYPRDSSVLKDCFFHLI